MPREVMYMTYVQGEWSKQELKSLFNFAPEDKESADPDVLYSGEMIDVEAGGIKTNLAEEIGVEPTTSNRQANNYSEIAAAPISIEGNIFEIKSVLKSKNAKSPSNKSRESIIEDLTGTRKKRPKYSLITKKAKIT